MLSLIKSELRDIRRNLLSAVLVTISLCIGVMSVLVTHELSVSILERFSSSGLQGSYDNLVQLHTRSEEEYFQLRQRWRSGEMPEVTHIVPVIEGILSLEGQTFNVLGYDPIATMPSRNGTVPGTQTDLRFMVEDSVIAFGTDLQPNDRIQDAVVVRKEDSRQQQLIADLPTAQHLLERKGEVDSLWLRTERNASPWWDLVIPGLLAAANQESTQLLLDGYELLPFSTWNPSEQLGDAIVFNLGMLSLLTLLVAGFIVFQAIQSNLRNREVQERLLDALGVSAARQRLLVLFQCSLFGLFGCVIGISCGATALMLLNGTSLSETWQALNDVAIWKAGVLGMTTALLAGILARRKDVQARNNVWWIGSTLALTGIGYGLWDGSGLLGASLLSICFCLLSIFCFVPLTIRASTFVLTRLPSNSITLILNLRNALTTASDIRLAINALSIAVATAIGIGLMLVSFRSEFTALLDQRLANDLHLSNASELEEAELAALEHVASVRAYRHGNAQLDGTPIRLIATQLDSFEQKRYGYEGESSNGIFINEIAARTHGFQIGDLVSINIALEPDKLVPILHIFKDYGEIYSRAIVPLELVRSEHLVADDFSIDTLQPDFVRANIDSQYPNVTVLDSDEIRGAAIQIFNASFATAQVMVNIAIFVAVIGMACALIGMQAKRLKEMRLLTMMGKSRASLALNALIQNALIGLFAVAVALPLSFALAWNLCYQVNPRAYGWSFDLTLSWEPVLLPVLLGVAAAMLAGLEPMRQALGKLVTQPISNVR